MYRPPPEYPRASTSPTIMMLVAGLTGVLGFLIGYLTGLGSGELAAGPAPRVTVTVEEPLLDDVPSEEPTSDPGASQPATSAPTVQPTVQPTAQPTVSQPGVSPTPGTDPAASIPANPVATDPADALASLRTLVVGVDIQPGTSGTAGPVGGGQCYWARMSSTTGGLGDVIDGGMPTGPATVTIEPTDKSFQTAGCAEWVRT